MFSCFTVFDTDGNSIIISSENEIFFSFLSVDIKKFTLMGQTHTSWFFISCTKNFKNLYLVSVRDRWRQIQMIMDKHACQQLKKWINFGFGPRCLQFFPLVYIHKLSDWNLCSALVKNGIADLYSWFSHKVTSYVEWLYTEEKYPVVLPLQDRDFNWLLTAIFSDTNA